MNFKIVRYVNANRVESARRSAIIRSLSETCKFLRVKRRRLLHFTFGYRNGAAEIGGYLLTVSVILLMLEII